ncbi:MAG: hypothetical protein P8173_11905 [Gammaproteobacteria bacterium]
MTNIGIHQDALSRYLDSLLAGTGEESPSTPVGQSSAGGHAPGTALDAVQEPVPTGVSDALSLVSFKVGNVPLAMNKDDILLIMEAKAEAVRKTGASGGAIRIKDQGRDIGVLDVREIIIPREHPARNVDRTVGKMYILLLKNFDCGLLCDGISDPVSLTPLDVEWRSRRTTRPWLVGMVNGFNYALLDAAELAHIYSAISH